MSKTNKKLGNHPLDVLIIGMGFSGICTAIKLIESDIKNIAIYEKSAGIGGTWHDNTYPGAACDVPSHLYSFSFAPNPNWTRVYSKQAEIKQYLEDVVTDYDLMSYANFLCQVSRIVLNEVSGLWEIEFTDGKVIQAHHVIHGGGGLHKPNKPKFNGLDTFTGTVMHTAEWNHEIDFANKNVAIIGSAASAIQVIPELAKEVKNLHIFQRTPNYILPRGDRAYTEKEKARFQKYPWLAKFYRWVMFMRLELITYPVIKKNSKIGKIAAKKIIDYMRVSVKNKALHDVLEPQYALGCKRILLSDGLYNAINKDHVELITNPIKSIKEDHLVTENNEIYHADIIVLATGFDITGHLHSIDIVGLNQKTLVEAWSGSEEAYRGCCVAGFPNAYLVTGPNTGAGTISHIHIIEQEVGYIVELIKLARNHSHIEVKKNKQDEYNKAIQVKLDDRVWSSGGCNSWYLNANGKNNTLYPENARTFKKDLSVIQRDDFTLTPKNHQVKAVDAIQW
jgi:cation diffusion facilitator CzcD-associated flavoprotein CzcO|tara:strand:+ start:49 stop:1569 length:1521 start_codon:yes stop_codon:yes gene_type:complete